MTNYIEISDDTVDALSVPGAIRCILNHFKIIEAMERGEKPPFPI